MCIPLMVFLVSCLQTTEWTRIFELRCHSSLQNTQQNFNLWWYTYSKWKCVWSSLIFELLGLLFDYSKHWLASCWLTLCRRHLALRHPSTTLLKSITVFLRWNIELYSFALWLYTDGSFTHLLSLNTL